MYCRYFVTTERRYSYASKDDGLTKTCNVTRLDGLPPADRLQSAWAGSGGGWEMVYPYTDRFLIEVCSSARWSPPASHSYTSCACVASCSAPLLQCSLILLPISK